MNASDITNITIIDKEELTMNLVINNRKCKRTIEVTGFQTGDLIKIDNEELLGFFTTTKPTYHIVLVLSSQTFKRQLHIRENISYMTRLLHAAEQAELERTSPLSK